MKKTILLSIIAIALVFIVPTNIYANELDGYGQIYCSNECIENLGHWMINCHGTVQSIRWGTQYYYTNFMNLEINENNEKLCLLYDPDNGYDGLTLYNGLNSIGNLIKETSVQLPNNTHYSESYMGSISYLVPSLYEVSNPAMEVLSMTFQTNLPIFHSKADADAYRAGTKQIYDADNYAKIYDEGTEGWISPFLNEAVNDNEVPYPNLKNVSYEGFELAELPENWYINVGVSTGLFDPASMEFGNKPWEQYCYSNFGFTTESSEECHNESYYLNSQYNVDVTAEAWENVNAFYTEFPDANTYSNNYHSNVDLPTVVAPLRKYHETHCNSGLWNIWTDVNLGKYNQLTQSDLYNFHQCFVTYKVQFYYFDETDGWHYGPFTEVTMYGNNKILYQNNYYTPEEGEAPIDSGGGNQDDDGNITIDEPGSGGGFTFTNDPTNMFAYINSLFLGLDDSFNNFSGIFGTVFQCLPEFLVNAIFIGIGVMIIVGIAKAVIG